MPFATNGNVRLFWKQDGANTRPALLLLTSILASNAVWDRLVPFLTDHFRVIRMDPRGHGASSAPSGDYTLAELAADAWAVIDAAEVDRALVCGLALGGLTAMQMGADRPNRLTGLVVANCSVSIDRDLWNDRIVQARQQGLRGLVTAALESWIDPKQRESMEQWIDPLEQTMLANPLNGYCGCAAAIRDMQLVDAIRHLRVPLLVISATGDRATSYSMKGQRLVELVPDATEVQVAGGHLACIENPGAFATGIGGFYDRLRPGGLGLDPARNGERIRREVLGDAWVDQSVASRDEWTADYQSYATDVAWHTVWGREGLDYRTRRLLVLAITAAMGRWEEFRLHVRSGLQQGSLTVQDVKEANLQAGLYAGVPVANTAFAECRRLFREMGIAARDC